MTLKSTPQKGCQLLARQKRGPGCPQSPTMAVLHYILCPGRNMSHVVFGVSDRKGLCFSHLTEKCLRVQRTEAGHRKMGRRVAEPAVRSCTLSAEALPREPTLTSSRKPAALGSTGSPENARHHSDLIRLQRQQGRLFLLQPVYCLIRSVLFPLLVHLLFLLSLQLRC